MRLCHPGSSFRQSLLEALLPRQGIDLEKVVNILPRPDIVDDAWKLLAVFEGKANQPRRPILLQPLDQPLGGRVVVVRIAEAMPYNDGVEVDLGRPRLRLAFLRGSFDLVLPSPAQSACSCRFLTNLKQLAVAAVPSPGEGVWIQGVLWLGRTWHVTVPQNLEVKEAEWGASLSSTFQASGKRVPLVGRETRAIFPKYHDKHGETHSDPFPFVVSDEARAIRNMCYRRQRRLSRGASADPVRTFQMTHRRVLACADHTNHGLVVVVKHEVGVFAPNQTPQCYSWDANARHGVIRHHYFHFGSGVTGATLALTDARQREPRVRSLDVHVCPRSRT